MVGYLYITLKETEGGNMVKPTGTKRLWGVFAYALALSALVLFFCSKCSPAYPLNDWPDANVFFSAGKAMLQGKVIYRDLYDHKGPLLFFLHALCALLSTESFIGVYLLEILTNALFLLIAYRLIALYANNRLALCALPIMALMLYTSISFQMGDSAEELTLPMVLWPLYQFMVSLRTKEGQTSRFQLIVAGFLLGCIFWLKFTLVGMPACICLMLAWLGWKNNGLKGAAANIGWMFFGFVLSTLPWLVYFWAVDGFLPFLKVYLYDNLFLYAGAKEPLTLTAQLKAIIKSILSWIKDNPGYTLPLLISAMWLLLSKRFSWPEKITWALGALLDMITVFFGGRYYLYYGFAFAAFLPLFFIVLGQWLAARKSPAADGSDGAASLAKSFSKKALAGIAVLTALCIALCPLLSPNVKNGFLWEKDRLMQYRFAKTINQRENPTLLNYEFLDWGFYTAANVAPHLKYYHLPSMPLDELHSEQDRYVREGLSDFVVTRRPLREELAGLYTLVDTCPAPAGLWFTDVYLYQLTSQCTQ